MIYALYYQDPYSICRGYCTFSQPNFIYGRAVCICDSNDNAFISYLTLYNYNYEMNNNYDYYNYNEWSRGNHIFEHLTCFFHNFDNLFIFKNMGSYVIIFITVVQIISMSLYINNGINSINSFIVDLVKKNPPKRTNMINKNEFDDINTINNETDEHNTNNELNEDIKIEYINKDKRNNLKLKHKYKDNNNALIGRTNNFNRKDKEKDIKKDFNINQKYNNDNLISSKNNSSQIYSSVNQLKNTTNTNNNNNNYDEFTHIFTDYELNSMELYDAIINDKRTFLYFFKLQMKLKQEFYKTFCIDEPLYPYSIKTMSYFFNLSLNFIFNALLYTESQIYEGIKSKSKNAANIFLRAFLSFLIVECISYLLNCLLKNANYLRSLVYRVKKEKQLRIEAYQSVKNINKNYGIFIFIVIFFELIFWVYLSSYCYTYHGEQLELFLGFLITQFFIEIFCIPFALYLTCFRFLGLKYKGTTCYKMSQTYLDN